MALIKSGSLYLDSGASINLSNVTITKDETNGFLTIHASGYYYGDGSTLSGIVFNFNDQNDVPSSYSSYGNNYLKVNNLGNAVEFSSTISGTDINSYTKSQFDTISGSLQTQIDSLEGSLFGGNIDRSDIETVVSGAGSTSVVFDTAMSDSDYTLLISISNTVDSVPSIYSYTIEDKTASGFTVLYSGDIDSPNYKLEWFVVSTQAGESTTPTVDIAIFGGGQDSGSTNLSSIDYFTITTTGDASDFGDMTLSRSRLASTSNGANDRGILAFGPPYNNTIDYITISTPGNATVFGYLSNASYGGYGAATSNNTNERAIYAGEGNVSTAIYYWTISTLGNTSSFGNFDSLSYNCGATSNGTNERGVYGGGGAVGIKYITISTTGNSTNFGNLTTGRDSLCATSNLTNERGIFIGGTSTNIIDYITISTPGNATDFGDLVGTLNSAGATSNGTNERGVICGGTLGGATSNVIQYVTISTTGNAADFGDLISTRVFAAATSNG